MNNIKQLYGNSPQAPGKNVVVRHTFSTEETSYQGRTLKSRIIEWFVETLVLFVLTILFFIASVLFFHLLYSLRG